MILVPNAAQLNIALAAQGPELAIAFSEPPALPVGAVPVSVVFGGSGGSGSGSAPSDAPYFDSRNYPDFITAYNAGTDAGPSLQAAVDAISATGGGVLVIIGDKTIKRVYLNSSLWARNKVVIKWLCEISMGPRGRLGVGGKLDDGVTTYTLSANAPADSNSLVIVQDVTPLVVGTVLDVRGENDATGIAFERQRVTVTAQNIGTKTLTVSPALQSSFLTSYPASAYGATDKTTIKVVAQSTLTTVAEGSLDVTVANGAVFQINDVVCIEDGMMSADEVAGSSANQIHMETNIVRNVAGNVVTLMLPLAHTYNAAFAPKMIRTLPAKHAGHVDPHVFFSAQSDTNNQHCMLFLYAAFCNVAGLRVMGEPNVNPALSLGNRGHGCRMSDGCIGNVVFDTVIHRPAFWDAGQGYGVTFYNGARANTYKKVQGNGCRHTVLFFKGVSDNVAEDITSIDCRISDIDFHGANETRNTVLNVRQIGGSSVAPDSTTKVAAKFGNPTHQSGCRGNVVRNLDVTNGQDYAVYFLPSIGNRVENITGASSKGLLWKYDTGNNTLPMRDNWVVNVEFKGGTKHAETDGGPNKVIARCGVRDMTVRDAPMSGSSYDLSNADSFTVENCKSLGAGIGVSSYILQASGINSLRVSDFRADGSKRFLSLANCPGALIDRPVLTGQSERVPYYDAGGNDGARFVDYEVSGYDPLFVDAGAGSAGGIITPKRTAFKVATAGGMPLAITGAGGQIVAGTIVPLQTSGVSVMSATLKPRIPKGLIAVTAFIPYAWIDATNTAVATLYARSGAGAWACIGVTTVRLTAGATAGSPLELRAFLRHTLQDLSLSTEFELRFGSNSATSTLTLGDRFGGALTYPTLELREQVDL